MKCQMDCIAKQLPIQYTEQEATHGLFELLTQHLFCLSSALPESQNKMKT